ncbi:MAG: ribonuclease E activity regulator RraA [Ectothiorhodospiraceae bacterium]
MTTTTTDLCDAHADALSIATPMFQDYGGQRSFHGPVSTVKVFEDNSLVRAALEEAGDGRVLVVDGGGSMRCALLGDNLAAIGRSQGWAGVVVYGCIRDSADIAGMDFGVKALNTHPLKSVKKGAGERDVSVTFAGITIRAGSYLYADEDGLVVAGEPLHDAVAP